MKLSIKAKRNIGLVALTIAVIIIVLVVIVLVNKCEQSKIEKQSYIGKLCEGSKLDYKVVSLDKLDEFGSYKAKDGNVLLLIGAQLKAKKDITVKSGDFTVDDGKYINVENSDYYMLTSKKVSKGQEIDFYLLYEVKKGQIESFFLHAYGYKIDLGGTSALL